METQLFIGCRGNSNPKLREFTGIPGFDFDSDGFRINDHKTITSVGGMHRKRLQSGDLQRHRELIDKRWHIENGDALDLAVPAKCADPDQAARGLQHQLRFRSGYRYDPGLQEHGCHAD